MEDYLTVTEGAQRLSSERKPIAHPSAVFLQYGLFQYTLRIDDRAGIKNDSETARLVAGTACRRRRRVVQQHRPAGARRDGYSRIVGAAYPADCGAT
jgi:hypothetical protein